MSDSDTNTNCPDPQTSTLSDDELKILIRVDERTKATSEQLDRVATEVESNSDDVDDLQKQVKRNTTILNGLTVGGIAVTTWFAEKLARFNIF